MLNLHTECTQQTGNEWFLFYSCVGTVNTSVIQSKAHYWRVIDPIKRADINYLLHVNIQM